MIRPRRVQPRPRASEVSPGVVAGEGDGVVVGLGVVVDHPVAGHVHAGAQPDGGVAGEKNGMAMCSCILAPSVGLIIYAARGILSVVTL